jgi:hypothetical protein
VTSPLDTVHPKYGEASLADILPSALAVLGVPDAVDVLGLGGGPLADVRRVAVLLADGLGHHQLPLAARYSPALADLMAGPYARALTCGFPSTTPTSLTTLGTGVPPGRHGLLGLRVNLPGTDRLLLHLDWRDEPDPFRWQPVATQFERARAAGVAAHAVSRPEFVGSGLTIAAHRGAEFHDGSDVDKLPAAMLAAMADAPSLVYGYFRDIDGAGHRHGIGSPEWITAVRDLDVVLTRLVEGLPAGAALLVTADHGQVDVPVEGRFDADLDPRLRAGVHVLAGEPRTRYVHTLPGAAADVLATWRGVLGDAAWVVPREEAVADGWFGPVSEDHLRRVGDVVAVCRDHHVVMASETEPATEAAFVAYHGAATAAEMMIPLLGAVSVRGGG